MFSRTSTRRRKNLKSDKLANRRVGFGRRTVAVEALEDRRLLAIEFIAGPYSILSNRPDVGLGVIGQANFDELLVRVNPNDPANVVLTTHDGLIPSTNATGTFGPRMDFPDLAGGGNN